MLRSLLARWRPEDEATKISAATGQALAVGLGLFGLLSANFMLVFIAMFVYLGAAQEGAVARGRILTVGFPVRAAMVTDFRTLQHGDTIRDAGNLLLATSQQDFPVMHGGSVVGLLTRSALIRAMLAARAGRLCGRCDGPRLRPPATGDGSLRGVRQDKRNVRAGDGRRQSARTAHGRESFGISGAAADQLRFKRSGHVVSSDASCGHRRAAASAGSMPPRRWRARRSRLTLVDRRNFHLFQPLLYQVATGGLSPGEIASPLRHILSNAPQHERCGWPK